MNINYGFLPLTKENCYLFNKVYEADKCPRTNDIIGNSRKENYPVIKEFLEMVPEESSLMSQTHIFSHTVKRDQIYHFNQDYRCNYADYVIFDSSGPAPLNKSFYLGSLSPSLGYEIVRREENIFLMKRISSTEERCLQT